MVKGTYIRKIAAFMAMIILTLSMAAVPGIYAYLTDAPDALENNFTIALDPSTTVVEKYPSDYPNMNDSGLAEFEKLVQIGNTGYIDCYVRVKLNFSETEIRNESSFSWDGNTFYKYAEYKNHLPAGWVYDDSDDWFYYTPILYAGDWADLSENLLYDHSIGEYFYNVDDTNILASNIITTPLVKYIKTQFEDNKDMRTFAIDVIEESVPFYLGNDYKQAWTTYLAETWD